MINWKRFGIIMRDLKPAEKVYKAFYDTRKKLLYFNQLKEFSCLSDSSLANALKKLQKSNEIEQIKEKSNTFYRLKDRHLTGIYFTLFDDHLLRDLNSRFGVPIREFVSEMPRAVAFAILFGSVPRKQYRAGSDIDILVVLHRFRNGTLQREYESVLKEEIDELKERVSAKSVPPLSVIYTDTGHFANAEDRLIIEAKNTGYCIYGHSQYYEVMLKNERQG